jgi:hypothetical protein
MNHPFQVGKSYRNRAGEYVVQDIVGEEMVIRYVGGSTLKTRVSIQARIWENIQFEEQMAREEERRQLAQEASLAARRRTAREKRAKAKPKFQGFQKSDFEPKKRGIAWSSREQLGKHLAHELGQRAEGDFGDWIVPRQSQIHVARKEHYDRDARDRRAAFFVVVDEKGVDYGFRVGRPGGKAKARWHILAFLAILDADGKPRRALRLAMRTLDLSLDVYAMDVSYGQVGRIVVQERGFLWQHETAEEETTRRMNWKQMADYLRGVARGKQCEIVLRQHMPAKKALKAGAKVSSEMLTVFEALLPVYDATVGA